VRKSRFTFVLLVLIMSIILVACGGENSNGSNNSEEKPSHKEETNIKDLKEALIKLDNNYELEIDVLIYDELEAHIEILVDGNKSSYKEGDYIEFYYIRESQRELVVIEKKGTNYEKSEIKERKDKNYDIFNIINENWFDIIGENTFKIKDNSKNNLIDVFNFTKNIELVSATIKLDEIKNLNTFNIVFEEDRDTYYLNINVKNIGGVNITVPEVR